MTRHKFAVGQIVDFDSRLMPAPRPSGPFEVMRVLPAEDIHSQTYRIKSKTEPFERNAKEYEIVAVASPAAEKVANWAQWLGADTAGRPKTARPVRSR
jgi:hypothetical protein